jgi:hypothetical protein
MLNRAVLGCNAHGWVLQPGRTHDSVRSPAGQTASQHESGDAAMDGQRFDAVARSLATRQTRRGTLRRLVAVAGALIAAGLPARSKAGHNCTWIGCGCASGTLHPCIDGLVCCASNPGMPGGAGVCSNPGDCYGPCTGSGGSCTSCNWGESCPQCCSGYCGDYGSCI